MLRVNVLHTYHHWPWSVVYLENKMPALPQLSADLTVTHQTSANHSPVPCTALGQAQGSSCGAVRNHLIPPPSLKGHPRNHSFRYPQGDAEQNPSGDTGACLCSSWMATLWFHSGIGSSPAGIFVVVPQPLGEEPSMHPFAEQTTLRKAESPQEPLPSQKIKSCLNCGSQRTSI